MAKAVKHDGVKATRLIIPLKEAVEMVCTRSDSNDSRCTRGSSLCQLPEEFSFLPS